MRDFVYLQPSSVVEASQMLSDCGDESRLLAGGTALLLGMRQRLLTPTHLISLQRLEPLRSIAFDPQLGLRIGALVRHQQLADSELVQARFPVLASMASRVANPQVRNAGTIGGNLCYGDPSTDPPGCLLALGASLVLANAHGERVVSAEEFFVDFFQTALAPGELLVEVRVPPMADDAIGRYDRFLRTAAEHRPLATVAVVVRADGAICREARIAVGASTPIPSRAIYAEAYLEGQRVTHDVAATAADILAGEVEPISDSRGSENYRRDMIRVVARRALEAVFCVDSVR